MCTQNPTRFRSLEKSFEGFCATPTMWGLRKTPRNFTLMTGTSWGFAYKFEMMPLSVSLFRQRFTIFPYTLALFRIVQVTPREGTGGDLLDFLDYKILTELFLSEFRLEGECGSRISHRPPRTSEHPTVYGPSTDYMTIVLCC